jgi:hypothetical protein
MNKYLAIIIMALLLCMIASDKPTAQTYFWEIDEFIELRDAPEEQSYEGQAGRGVVVNTAEDALIFSSIAGSGGGASNETIDCIVVYSGEIVAFSGNVICFTGT